MPGLDVQITTEGLDETLTKLAGFDALVLRETEHTMRRAVDVVEAAIAQRTPENTGNLRDSWGTNVERGFNTVKGTVSPAADYAVVVEKGRRPGGKLPPYDAIERWAYLKLGLRGDELKRATTAIRWKIKLHGTKGAHMAEDGFNAVKPIVEADLAGVAGRVAARFEAT